MKYCLSLIGLCLVLITSGCITIPNSPTPRFYALTPIDETKVIRIHLPADLMIGVGPVKIPEYQDRPQIVTITSTQMLQFAQFDRWGESLDEAIARLIRENLSDMLPQAKLISYPWNPSTAVKYQVNVEIVQLDSELDSDMHLVVQWMIVDVQNSKTMIIKRSEFRDAINPQNYLGLAKTLSTDCAALSTQIAQAMATLK